MVAQPREQPCTAPAPPPAPHSPKGPPRSRRRWRGSLPPWSCRCLQAVLSWGTRHGQAAARPPQGAASRAHQGLHRALRPQPHPRATLQPPPPPHYAHPPVPTWKMARPGLGGGRRGVMARLFSLDSHSWMVTILRAGGGRCRCVRRAFFRWWKSPSVSVYLRGTAGQGAAPQPAAPPPRPPTLTSAPSPGSSCPAHTAQPR